MGKVRITEVQGYTEWASGVYNDGSGEFNIVFIRSFDQDTGFRKEVISVERAGIGIERKDPLWSRVKQALEGGEI